MSDRISRRFYVIDYDRCLGNAEQLYALLQQSVVTVVPEFDLAAMDRERDRVEATGGSFDELEYVRQWVTSVQYDMLLRRFVESGRRDPDVLLEAGARELLTYLKPCYPFGILTYGSRDWQLAKISASLPASVPTVVIDHKYKIRHIKEWKDATTGLFELQDVFRQVSGYRYAEEVILVDDKAAAFEGIDASMRGYWITHRELLPSQKGTVGPRVARVSSFPELIALEEVIVSQ